MSTVLVMGSCVICETTQTGCPWSRPRVSLSIYLSIYLHFDEEYDVDEKEVGGGLLSRRGRALSGVELVAF